MLASKEKQGYSDTSKENLPTLFNSDIKFITINNNYNDIYVTCFW